MSDRRKIRAFDKSDLNRQTAGVMRAQTHEIEPARIQTGILAGSIFEDLPLGRRTTM